MRRLCPAPVHYEVVGGNRVRPDNNGVDVYASTPYAGPFVKAPKICNAALMLSATPDSRCAVYAVAGGHRFRGRVGFFAARP